MCLLGELGRGLSSVRFTKYKKGKIPTKHNKKRITCKPIPNRNRVEIEKPKFDRKSKVAKDLTKSNTYDLVVNVYRRIIV